MAASLALALPSDTLTAAPAPELVWVGTSDAQADGGYRRFLQALAAQPVPRRHVPVRYHAVRDQGSEAAQEDLARSPPAPAAVWIAPTADAARAVRAQYPGQALIFASYQDPIRLGLVRDLRRPAGRATGVVLDDDLHAKRLELLRDAFPQVRVVGVLLDRSWTETRDVQTTLAAPAQALGLQVRLFYADDPAQVDALFAGDSLRELDGWYIPATYIAYRSERAICDHLMRLKQPAIHTSAGEVARCALMAYSQDTSFVHGMLAELATRVAAGEEPGTIPVQRPMRFVLSVRPRDDVPALRIHPSVVRRADRIF